MTAIDILILTVFFIANIIAAVFTRRKAKTLREYVLGDRKSYNSWVIIATLVATLASGSMFINNVQQTCAKGLNFVVHMTIAAPLCLIFYIIVMIPKINKMPTLSVHEWFGKLYGTRLECVSGFCEAFFQIGRIAIQLRIIGLAVQMIFNADLFWSSTAIVVIAIGLIFYSSFGGLTAVSFTDVIQTIFFVVIILFIPIYVWGNVDDHSGFVSIMHGGYDKLTWSSCFTSSEVTLATLAMWFKALIPPCHVTTWYQRVQIGHGGGIGKVQRTWMASIMLYLFVNMWIIFLALQLIGLNFELTKDTILPYFLDTFAFSGLSGMIFVCIVSLAMSTADSELAAISAVFTNDVFPVFKIKFLKKDFRTVCISAWIIGLIALIFALHESDIFEMLMKASCFSLPVVTIPILATVLGLRTHKNCIWIAMACGFIATVTYMYQMRDTNYSQYGFFPGILANTIGLTISHLYYKYVKGWKWNGVEPWQLELNNLRDKLMKKIREKYEENNLNIYYDYSDWELWLGATNERSWIFKDEDYKRYKELIYKCILERECDLDDIEYDKDKQYGKVIAEHINAGDLKHRKDEVY